MHICTMISTLCEPVTIEGDTIIVLDESRLPFEESYIYVKSLSDAASVLKNMKTRAYGQVLLYFYTCALCGKIDEVTLAFHKARPTFDFARLENILKINVGETGSIASAARLLIIKINDKRIERAKRVAVLLPAKASILTICNMSGELIFLYDALIKLGKRANYFISETRPYLQGTRLTLWELHKMGIDATLLYDNQAAVIMQQGLVNCVIVGSDRCTIKGDIFNKIGTYALARLAMYYNIPFYALVQMPQDIDINDIAIEERPAYEVFAWLQNNRYYPDAAYPAFDITPSEYITRHFDLMSI